MPLQLTKIHPLYGVEIAGVDLAGPIDDATFAEIRAAFEEHSILVFHNQTLDDETQIAFSKRFGPLETMLIGSMGAGTAIADLSNVDPTTDTIIPADDRRMIRNSANMMWHSDSSFKKVPALASLLSGREVPPEGGETEFATLRGAYDALPDDIKQKIDGRIAEHSFTYSRSLVDPGLLRQAEKDEVPPVKHPLVRENPVNGRKAYYVGSHASHIIDMPIEKGRALLRKLVDFAIEPRFVYCHKWRSGDLVMWDNRAVLHRGRPWDSTRHRRVMHRTTVAGDGPTVPDEAAV
jgi:alpha-ketoglutarate-dependent 2,4-dichlorophenoxyacetate dioxygenase